MEDSGIGISDELRTQLLHSVENNKPNEANKGVGFFFNQQAIKLLGGSKLEVNKNKDGEGCKIDFKLQVSEGCIVDESGSESESGPQSEEKMHKIKEQEVKFTQRKSILLVDDSEEVRWVLQ